MNITRVKVALGEQLGNFNTLFYLLFLYLVGCLATYFILRCQLPSNQSPALVTYLVATGGDPAPFLLILTDNPVGYYWIGFLHILSWLIVPAVIASLIDASYRLHEQHMLKAERTLRNGLKEILTTSPLPAETKQELIEQFIDDLKSKRS